MKKPCVSATGSSPDEISRRDFLKASAVAGMGTMLSGCGLAASAGKVQSDSARPDETTRRGHAAPGSNTHPNILLIIADDLSWHSTGYAGDPVVQTPNLDRIARQGTVFTHAAVTTSICMVSRASLLTGQYLTRMGGARVKPETWLDTWPARLRSAGYYGGHIGKVHVRGQSAKDYDFWAGRGEYAWLEDGKGGRIHSIEKDTRETLKFIETRPKHKPFFLQLAYTVPHAAHWHPEQYLPMPDEEGLYKDVRVSVPKTGSEEYFRRLPKFLQGENTESRKRWRKRFDTPEKYQKYTKNYYRLVSGMDRSIGQVLKALSENGAADNTVIVFIGDNGYFLGEHGLADKWYPYEESVRVPMLIFDPRLPVECRGRTNDDWVLNVDIAPTFCSLAGLTPPDSMQGRDITPLLRGNTPKDWRTEFLHQFKWRNESIPASEALCSKDWKYIRWTESGQEELFILKNDPRETRDISRDPKHVADLQRLRARFEELRRDIGGIPLKKITDMPYGPKTTRQK